MAARVVTDQRGAIGAAESGALALRNLPAALAPLVDLRNWVVWRWEMTEKGKQTKVPYQADRPEFKAKNNDPQTWASYATALSAYEAGKADGIGFCLLNSEFAAFDLDKCRDPATGLIDSWAQALVERVGSYTEITVSGTGLRIIGRGSGPKIHRKQSVDGGSLETYRRAERYIDDRHSASGNNNRLGRHRSAH